jgi:hypothetical protein
MNFALQFHVNREGMSYWIHGGDVPGYPASHGCICLYDKLMQKEQYGGRKILSCPTRRNCSSGC